MKLAIAILFALSPVILVLLYAWYQCRVKRANDARLADIQRQIDEAIARHK